MGFMLQIRPDVLKKLREDYPTGCRVELVQMFEETTQRYGSRADWRGDARG